jgi:hypothetical protein
MGLCEVLSRKRSESVYGPVALMMPCLDVRYETLGREQGANFGADVELSTGELVFDLDADEFPLGILVELGDATVVGDCRTQLDGGHD